MAYQKLSLEWVFLIYDFLLAGVTAILFLSDNRLHPTVCSLGVGSGWAGPRRGIGLSADPTRREHCAVLPWLAFVPPRGSTALRHSAWSADVVIHKQGRQTLRNICCDGWWVNDLAKNRSRIPPKHASNWPHSSDSESPCECMFADIMPCPRKFSHCRSWYSDGTARVWFPLVQEFSLLYSF
jgi:hypothetical protein